MRSNRSIARGFARQRPGQSKEATIRRVQRKLSTHRRYYTFVHAVWLSEAEYPYAKHLEGLRELVKIGIHRDQWAAFLDLQNWSIGEYRANFGAPDADLSMQALRTASPKAEARTKGAGNFLRTLFAAQLISDFGI